MMWRWRIRRAMALVRARRFAIYLEWGPHRPGGWTAVPTDVDLGDVVLWQRTRTHAKADLGP